MMTTVGNPILAGLARLMRAGRPLDLLNLHQGAPVVYPAQVEAVDEPTGTARLLIPSFRVICLTLETTTILLSQMLEEAVGAHVLTVDVPAGRATLGQFQYASHHVGDRMTVRVTPRQPTLVTLEYSGRTTEGQLTDLSISGLGLVLAPAQVVGLRPRGVVRVRLPLPPEAPSALELAGAVRFVRPEVERVRVGITLAQDAQMLSLLPYVRERQNEILTELKTLYTTYQPHP